jgi:glycerate 2-kinase
MSAKPEPPAAPSRALLESLFRSAVAAAHPDHCLPPNLPDAPAHGRLVILAAGKAAGSMTQVAEGHYEESRGLRSPATATAARRRAFR